MKNKSHTIKLQILKYLFDTKKPLTASQIGVSNANQYLIPSADMNLIKRHKINNSKCKFSYIDNDTRLKAEDYLKRFNLMLMPTPLHIVNDYVEDFEMHGNN